MHLQQEFLKNLAHLNQEETGRPVIRRLIRLFGGDAAAGQFDDAVDKAKAQGVNWWQIILAILPLVLSLLGGGGGNLPAIIQQIIALIGGLFPIPTPTPPVPAH